MIEKLDGIEEKLEDLNRQLCDPEVASNQEKYKTLMKEVKNLTPVVEKYEQYKAARSNLETSKEMLDEKGLDRESKDMLIEEIGTCQRANRACPLGCHPQACHPKLCPLASFLRVR